jgi:predicted CoA-binding protein
MSIEKKQRVAVLGASDHPERYSHKAVRELLGRKGIWTEEACTLVLLRTGQF